MHWTSLIRNYLFPSLCGLVCLAATSGATTTPKKKPATASTTSSSKSSTKSGTHKKRSRTTKGKSAKARGQKTIESERAQQIQEALIREHYMNGEPSGKWDDSTQSALRRYQADQGWQSKSVPDSRALIKLGLGPSHDHLLNPETAMTTAPSAGGNTSTKPVAANPVARPVPPSVPPSAATPHQ